jgi:hypothetical protein
MLMCDDSDGMSNDRANPGCVVPNRKTQIEVPRTRISASIETKNQALARPFAQVRASLCGLDLSTDVVLSCFISTRDIRDTLSANRCRIGVNDLRS